MSDFSGICQIFLIMAEGRHGWNHRPDRNRRRNVWIADKRKACAPDKTDIRQRFIAALQPAESRNSMTSNATSISIDAVSRLVPGEFRLKRLIDVLAIDDWTDVVQSLTLQFGKDLSPPTRAPWDEVDPDEIETFAESVRLFG